MRSRGGGKAKLRVIFAVVFFVVVLLVVLAAPTGSFPTGPPNSAFADGCNCHSPTPTKTVTGYIGGLPDHYDPGKKYELLVGLVGGPAPSKDPSKNRGGFLLGASAGKFGVPSGSDQVQVSAESINVGTTETPITLVTQARQTGPGALSLNRSWALEWTAPDPPVGDVFFVLYVNSVNGNAGDGSGNGNTGDEWNTNTFGSRGEGGFKVDPALTAYTNAAVLMGSMGIILTVLFSILGYVLIARGSGRGGGPAPKG